MLRKFLRVLGWLATAAVALTLFGLAGYLSFNQFVRRGVTPVPDVVGQEESAAASLLRDQGLVARRQEGDGRFDEEIPRGHIQSQIPAAGSFVKRGGRVTLVVSLGREVIEVPDLRSQPVYAAQVSLATAGLAGGRSGDVFCSGGVSGTVFQQRPAAGDRVSRSTPVDLLLCQDHGRDTYVMPDLVYRDYEEVRRQLSLRGLRFGNVKFEPYEGVAPGVVLRQFPLAGHPLQRREVISLVVTTSERPIP